MADDSAIDRGKRAFLRAPLKRDAAHARAADPWRPPWAAPGFEDACTRCGTCLDACPEGILTSGDGGFPEVDVQQGSGECTFCRACVEACPEPAFRDPDDAPAWDRVADIGTGCLAKSGVHCQTCGDVCDWEAIRFVPEVGAPPQPNLAPDACTGCGACIAACPARAIGVTHRSSETAGKGAASHA